VWRASCSVTGSSSAQASLARLPTVQGTSGRLELIAREQGADGTYLGRKVIREYVERQERRQQAG
jgi:hypothetical protein